MWTTVIRSIFMMLVVASCHGKSDQEQLDGDTNSAPVKNYTQEKMTVSEFVSWCADGTNKLNKVKDISDIQFNLSYLPPAAMAFLELRKEPYDLAKFKATCDNYSEMTYFNFKIEAIGASGELLKYKLRSPAQYQERIQYTSFDMQKDLWLVQGNDTLLPGLFQFERIFEVAPYGIAMFGFDNKRFDRNNEFTIVYNDKLFEKGFVKFNYKNKQLINLPNISEL